MENKPNETETKKPSPQEVAQQIQINAVIEELSGQISMHSRRGAEMASALAMSNAELQGLRKAVDDMAKATEKLSSENASLKAETEKLRAELIQANGLEHSSAT